MSDTAGRLQIIPKDAFKLKPRMSSRVECGIDSLYIRRVGCSNLDFLWMKPWNPLTFAGAFEHTTVQTFLKKAVHLWMTISGRGALVQLLILENGRISCRQPAEKAGTHAGLMLGSQFLSAHSVHNRFHLRANYLEACFPVQEVQQEAGESRREKKRQTEKPHRSSGTNQEPWPWHCRTPYTVPQLIKTKLLINCFMYCIHFYHGRSP